MKRCKGRNTELPNCVLSFIFSKLAWKDLVKTSALSKHWCHEFGFTMKDIKDLNFDAYNMFGYNPLEMVPHHLQLRAVQSQFATGLDQLVLHHQGATINSVRVKFPLEDKHRNVIDRLISQGVAKGVERIELLFSVEPYRSRFIFEIEPYGFSFSLLSTTTTDDSLMYLHLENCFIVEPTGFSGLRNLRTLVLQFIVVEKKLLLGLIPNCVRLEDLTLDDCEFNSGLKIISPPLIHLKIVNCRGDFEGRIDIIASNLSSLEYSCNGYRVHPINIQARKLLQCSYKCRQINGFLPMNRLKNVTTLVLEGIDECLHSFVIPYLFEECLQLEDLTFRNCSITNSMEITSTKLRHLNIIRCCSGDFNPYKISIDALNLSSFEFIGHTVNKFSVVAPKLSKVFWNASIRHRYPFGPIPKLHQIENLSIIINYSQIAKLTTVLGRLQNLRHLELFINHPYEDDMEYFSIFDILMAARRLQKISLTVIHSVLLRGNFDQRKRRYASFFHNDLKFVELHGCVCTRNAIEFARHLMRNVNSLKKITFGSNDNYYLGAGRWTEGTNIDWFDRNFIQNSLEDEVKGKCQLIIL